MTLFIIASQYDKQHQKTDIASDLSGIFSIEELCKLDWCHNRWAVVDPMALRNIFLTSITSEGCAAFSHGGGIEECKWVIMIHMFDVVG